MKASFLGLLAAQRCSLLQTGIQGSRLFAAGNALNAGGFGREQYNGGRIKTVK